MATKSNSVGHQSYTDKFLQITLGKLHHLYTGHLVPKQWTCININQCIEIKCHTHRKHLANEHRPQEQKLETEAQVLAKRWHSQNHHLWVEGGRMIKSEK